MEMRSPYFKETWDENTKLSIDLTTLPIEVQKSIRENIFQILESNCEKHGKYVDCKRSGLYCSTRYDLTFMSSPLVEK